MIIFKIIAIIIIALFCVMSTSFLVYCIIHRKTLKLGYSEMKPTLKNFNNKDYIFEEEL